MMDKNGNSGKVIEFDYATSTGFHQDEFGNGSLDISLGRPNAHYKWLDLLDIKFTQPTSAQFKKCAEATDFTEESSARQHMFRRLSFAQANYVKEILVKALRDEFANGIIPSDEEIKQILAGGNAKVTVTPQDFIDVESIAWTSLPDLELTARVGLARAVRNSVRDVFSVGEEVKHQGAADTAVIERFGVDQVKRDILAVTTKGIANVQFLEKIQS